jgi:paired amphipathic helix protein Sin3a
MWQYYVASYTMSEPTEGVDLNRLLYPFLRRNVRSQDAKLQTTVAEFYSNLRHFDNQTAFISPDTYKLFLSNDYIFWQTKVKPNNKYDLDSNVEERKFIENEPFREKFVRNTAWMKDQDPEAVARRKAVWEQAVKDGLDGFEETMAS